MPTNIKRNSEETKDFMVKAYEKATQELNVYLKKIQKTDKEIKELMELANFAYQIDKTSKDYKTAEQFIVSAVLSMLSNEDEWLENLIDNFFEDMFDEIIEYFGYYIDDAEREKILKRKFEGKTYNQRIKTNQEKIRNRTEIRLKYSYKRRNLNNLNYWLSSGRKMSIKRAKDILTSELNRIANDIFIFCNRNKKFKYCSVLEANTCSDCASMDGMILTAEQAYDLIPQHNHCKCYLEVLR